MAASCRKGEIEKKISSTIKNKKKHEANQLNQSISRENFLMVFKNDSNYFADKFLV